MGCTTENKLTVVAAEEEEGAVENSQAQGSFTASMPWANKWAHLN
jgi:hypothetical protein